MYTRIICVEAISYISNFSLALLVGCRKPTPKGKDKKSQSENKTDQPRMKTNVRIEPGRRDLLREFRGR